MKPPLLASESADMALLAPEAGGNHADRSPNAVAMRLQRAVKEAGGRDRVAAERGIAKRTLTRALNGDSVRRGTLLEIAGALNLPADWLLEGRGPFRPEWVRPGPAGPQPGGLEEVTKGATMPPPADKPSGPDRGLFATVDVDRLSTAIQSAEEAVRAQGGERNWRAITQVALLLYDEATRRTQNPSEPPGQD